MNSGNDPKIKKKVGRMATYWFDFSLFLQKWTTMKSISVNIEETDEKNFLMSEGHYERTLVTVYSTSN